MMSEDPADKTRIEAAWDSLRRSFAFPADPAVAPAAEQPAMDATGSTSSAATQPSPPESQVNAEDSQLTPPGAAPVATRL